MNSVTLVPKNCDNQLVNPELSNSRLITPSKVVCIGRNYVEHIKELSNEIPDEMVVFLKPNSAISNDLHALHNGDSLHYEAELCFLYQGGRFSAVALGLDLTKRDVQSQLKAKGLPWERAKAFNGSATFSKFVAIDDEQINQLTLSLTINNKATQQGGVSLMMYKPEKILKDIQSFLTLEEGDIVMTGTPKGVGVVNVLDNFTGHVLLEQESSREPLVILEHQWQAK